MKGELRPLSYSAVNPSMRFMIRPCKRTLFIGMVAMLTPFSLFAEDLVVADFESGEFGGWKVTGDAFGASPAKGSLPGQMEVSGFEGSGYLSSFHGGDDSKGKAMSPPFEVERRFLNFLVGGGGFEGETCVNLVSPSGEVLRTAAGPNQRPGGSEKLQWETWDLAGLEGQSVSIEVVDQREGGWGHISADHFLLSDKARVLEVEKEFLVDKRYLVWPVTRNEEKSERFVFKSGSDWMTYANIALAAEPDHWFFTDLGNMKGKTVKVAGRITGDLMAAWEMVELSDTYPGEDQVYAESRRPLYHFTSRRGWLNDPNGLVFANGEWHLCYQHNPYNVFWDNMTWGHAVSEDLFHWRELPPALFPDEQGVMYSGSGFIVPSGKSKLPIRGKSGIGFAYTAWGELSVVPGKLATQGIAYSNDEGRTFTKLESNPVIGHIVGGNRDPKVLWHEATKRWVMALYHDGNQYGIHVSEDLVTWEQTSTFEIPGDSECPDLFPLAIDGGDESRWMVWGANGVYLLGDFDGRTFTPTSEPQRHYWGHAYAGQSYDNAPEGRRVHIGWMRGEVSVFDGAPFSLQMSLPMDFHLRSFDGRERLWIEPSPEVDLLRKPVIEKSDLVFSEGDRNPLEELEGKAFEVEAIIDANETTAKRFGLTIFGETFAWNAEDRTFTGAEGIQVVDDGEIRLRVFSDVGTVEIFANGTYIGRYLRQEGDEGSIVAEGGSVKFKSLRGFSIDSVWR